MRLGFRVQSTRCTTVSARWWHWGRGLAALGKRVHSPRWIFVEIEVHARARPRLFELAYAKPAVDFLRALASPAPMHITTVFQISSGNCTKILYKARITKDLALPIVLIYRGRKSIFPSCRLCDSIHGLKAQRRKMREPASLDATPMTV